MTSPATAGPPSCTAPQGVLDLAAPTPALTRAFQTNAAIRIVAFGSSSTEGAGASARDRTYPARLQAALGDRFPGRTFEVLNRGKGGELATDMLARIDRDVIDARPTLVIWQTGVNDAIMGVGRGEFRTTVEAGIAHMRQNGIDVVLLDQQYYPRAAKVAGYAEYLTLIRTIGETSGVPVFHRYELMAHLVETAQYRVEDLLAPDHFHQNDLGYDCLGTALADAFRARLAGVAAGPVVPASLLGIE